MEMRDGIRAWLYLRHVEAYVTAWRAHAGQSVVFEPGPFPIRVQTAADLEADRFDLLAWQNPWDAGARRLRSGVSRGWWKPFWSRMRNLWFGWCRRAGARSRGCVWSTAGWC